MATKKTAAKAVKKQEGEAEQPETKQSESFTENITRDLECVLSKESLETRAAQCLQVSNERKAEIGRASSLRQEASTLKSKAKEKDEEAREAEREAELLLSEIMDLIRAVNDKVESRPVECTREFDYKADKVRIIRNDTGEIVEEREMRNSERQRILNFQLDQREQGKEGYVDKRGRLLFVSDGFTDGESWGTFYRGETGALKRFTGKGLDLRADREQAERDLAKYSEEHKFDHVNAEGIKKEPAKAPQQEEEKAESEDKDAA